VTGFLEAREIPQVGEITALLGLHGLHGAIIALQKNTFAVRFLFERKPATVFGEPRELLNECNLAHAFERGESRHLAVAQADIARPPATGGATLAFMEDRHEPTLQIAAVPAKSEW